MTTTTHRYQSDFARRYFSAGEAQGEAQGEARGKAEGKAQGEADAVLVILDARGIDVPEPIRAEIAGCTDLDRLGGWIRQAATAHKIEDLDL